MSNRETETEREEGNEGVVEHIVIVRHTLVKNKVLDFGFSVRGRQLSKS